MGVLTYETEVATGIPPTKMFKVFVLDADNIIPQILPQAIKSIEILEGNGGPGTIKKTTFAEGNEFKYVKNKIEAIDKDNFTYSYTSIEGEPWIDTLEKVYYEVKIVPSADGGSICKTTSKYYSKVIVRSMKPLSRLVKKKSWECSRLLKPISWQILVPTTKNPIIIVGS
ncbi:hypothetical protein GH714_029033 [Hevea brasiliensis]|uniref:Bet v I/Major latex protein domain-containing protein n=1 Tax=Hevea brasiliensis TaxID=3981 RepID=A0A6A6KNV8_HEVBR|nr:hypothetical protein GH714_029033 [Hevea brasiliensis]